MRCIFFLSVLLFLFTSNSATVLTVNSLDEFLRAEIYDLDPSVNTESLKSDSLVSMFVKLINANPHKSVFVTDLDETLLASKNYFGSTEWFKKSMPDIRRTYKIKYPDFNDEEIERLVDERFWRYIEQHTAMKEADFLYAKLLRQLHDSGHLVLALTARLKKYSAITNDQLKSIGMDFLSRHIIYSPHNPDWSSNKGPVLKNFADGGFGDWLSPLKFNNLYYFDDSKKEIESVEESFSKEYPVGNRVKIIHAHWSRINRQKERTYVNFNEIGSYQMHVFERSGFRLSNEESSRLMHRFSPQEFICFKLYQ